MTNSNDHPKPDAAFQRHLLEKLPRLRPYARKLAYDESAAEDLVQDTLLRALEKHYQWERGTNLVAWLRTIMRNRHFECGRKKQPVGIGDVTADPPDICSRDAEQLTNMELKETGAAIDTLDKEFRIVLETVVFDGASYESAAESLNVPVGTIRSRLSRARSALRAELNCNRRYPVWTAPDQSARTPLQ